MSPAYLLDCFTHLGVEVRAEGGRLRVRAPRGVMTQDLLGALREHKAALLDRLSKPVTAAPPDRAAARPTNGEMAFGDVCPGWTPVAWANELRRKAERCDGDHPDIATYFRAWADDVQQRLASPSNPGRRPHGGDGPTAPPGAHA